MLKEIIFNKLRLSKKIITISSLFGFIFFSLGVVESKIFRYQRLPYSLEAINEAPKKIDILFLGTSASMLFVHTNKINQSLANIGINNITSVDLSRNWQGMGAEFTILKDLINEKKIPKYIFLEIIRDDIEDHDLIHQLSSIPDLWQGTMQITSKSIPWRIQRFCQHLNNKFLDAFNRILTRRVFLAGGSEVNFPFKSNLVDDKNKFSIDPFQYSEKHDLNKLAEIIKVRYENPNSYYFPYRFKTGKPYDYNMDYPENARNIFFIKKISKLAKSINAKLILVDMPRIERSVLSKDAAENLANEYDSNVFYFDENQLQAIYKEGLSDHAHATSKGSDLYAKYFAIYFKKIYKNTEEGSL